MKNVHKKAKTNRTCITPGCLEEIGERSMTCLCRNCYSYIYNNLKRSTGDLVKRSNKLTLFRSRMCFIIPEKHLEENETKLELLVKPGSVKKYRRRSRHQPPLKIVK